MLQSNLLIIALSLGTVFASPLDPRDELTWINHDDVESFAEDVPSGIEGDLMKKHQPLLLVKTGCVPFPAVQSDGSLNGLKASGSMSGKCGKSEGQVYSRSGSWNDRWAIMYAWYFPKDQNVDGPANQGHRHDWENIVVWLTGKTEDAEVTGVSFSAHSTYRKYRNANGNSVYFRDDSHPLVQYSNSADWLDHSLDSYKEDRNNKDDGGQQPLIGWTQLPEKASTALKEANFKKAGVPFKDDATWDAKLTEAWSSDF